MSEELDKKIEKTEEECITCGNSTGVREDTHVDERLYYVEGAGQLCPNCYKTIYTEKNKEQK